MCGAHLGAHSCLPFGHYRERKRRDINTVLHQLAGELLRDRGFTGHNRYDWVFDANDIKSSLGHAAAEISRIFSQLQS